MIEISPHLHVQNIALRVLRDIVPFIKAGKTESSVVDVCTQLLEQDGAKDLGRAGLDELEGVVKIT